FYEENFNELKDGKSVPGDLQGNALTVAAPNLRIRYRGRQQLHLPFFLSIEAELPVALRQGLEVGHLYDSAQTFFTQQEQITQKAIRGRIILGFELLPFLQPYVGLSRVTIQQRRMDQQDGK